MARSLWLCRRRYAGFGMDTWNIPKGTCKAPIADLAAGLNINQEAISVSGISSGAFMAHQFHIAHSEHIMGAGIIAGGPYYCARGSILDAVTKCSRFVDLAGAILKHIYGDEALASERVETDEDDVPAFDQRRVFKKFFPRLWPVKARNAFMAKHGYLCIPQTCREGEKCMQRRIDRPDLRQRADPLL